ncbi:MAG: TIGR00270 family protein [Candidatus Methanomethylicota archaeon]|uniref:TIGR00270 family protein n=1 Tax=Thermoproteota archaeon TaxID=2056631 RepID=A0A497ETN3_9CREN|nr:MAG: TIGR00270 family protein [Candidatus Verstraetearchaeota archaeon]
MNCEICGKPIIGTPRKIVIEKTVLTVCAECAKYGTPVRQQAPSAKKPSTRRPLLVKPSPDLLQSVDLVEGYGKIIKDTREAMGITREVFARMLGEKESVIRRIELEEMRPTIDLAKKIEKILKVKLLKPLQEEYPLPHFQKTSLTFGDVVVLRKREKNE